MNTKKRYSKPEIEIWSLEMEPFMFPSSVTNPTGIIQEDTKPTDVSYFSNKSFGQENE